MPRKYQPNPGSGKHYKNYSAEKIKMAVEDLKGGLSVRKAAEKHDIHYSVLYRHWKRGDQMKNHGGQTALTSLEEKLLVDRLQICGEWGYPIDSFTLRIIVKEFLDHQGKTVRQFKDNMPGRDFVYSFMQRHKNALSMRMCQNIKRSRAAITPEVINAYFDRLEEELKDVPPSNIINYDEINLCDDPGRRKVIIRRGSKYPERVMNSTKVSTSVMFAAAGDGTILPPYVVYKAQHLYQSWREGGPKNSRYNRTKSGWFDSYCFEDWVETVALPYLRKLDGKTFLIGDNLASHLSLETIKMCSESNVSLIFLPSNSTHLTQPLDVAFFRPMKILWRGILEEWKKGPGRTEPTIPKDKFPGLLKKLCDGLKEGNVIAGFKKSGIVPLCRDQVLRMLPHTDISKETNEQVSTAETIDNSFKELLKSMRHDDLPKPRKKRTKIDVIPGKSVGLTDVNIEDSTGPVNQDPEHSLSTTKISTSSKNRAKRVLLDSSSDNSDFSLRESDEDSNILSEEEDIDTASSGPNGTSLLPGDFAVVKVYGKTKESFRLYVSRVSHPSGAGYMGTFYKRTPQTMRFSETLEESYFSHQDVVHKLSTPISSSSARFKDMISFPDDLSNLTIY